MLTETTREVRHQVCITTDAHVAGEEFLAFGELPDDLFGCVTSTRHRWSFPVRITMMQTIRPHKPWTTTRGSAHQGHGWRVDVIVDGIGYLGTYRRSSQTNRWFAGRHTVHQLGVV